MMVCRRTGNLTHLVRWGLLFAGLGCSAQAQTAQLQPVTIQQAVAEAVEKNLNVLAEKYSIPIAEARIITAKLAPESGAERGRRPPGSSAGPATTQENGAGPPEYSIRTDFVFERGAKRQRRIDVAQAAVSTAQLQFLNTVRSVVLDVQSAFVELLQAKADLALAEETLEAFRQTVQINTSRVRSGDLAEVELIRTQVAELQFENTVAQARLKVDIGRSKLQVLLGRRKVDKLPDATGELRRDELAVTVDDPARTRIPRLALITLLCSGTLRGPRRNCDCSWRRARWTIRSEPNTGDSRDWPGRAIRSAYFFSSSVPVFNRNQGEIERARQEQSQAEARIRAIQATIENEVETAYLQYQNGEGIAASRRGNHAGQGNRCAANNGSRLPSRRRDLSRFSGCAEGLQRHRSTAQYRLG